MSFRSAALIALAITSVSAVAETSDLWGHSGERWQPEGRLPYFSFAGFAHGEKPLPQAPVRGNVRDFGAVGDGRRDDTEAFRKAIAAVNDGALLVPAGRYVISDFLEIRKSHFVLRGEGADKSVLFFPRTLTDVRPNLGATTSGRPTSNYSWSGGFIMVKGDFRASELARVTQPARRGDRALSVSAPEKLRIGQWIEVRVSDLPDNSLAAHLYAGQPGPMDKLLGRTRASLTAQITALRDGRIELNRALPFDVELRWSPRLLAFEPTVTHSGIEQLGFEFPATPYGGHFTELGRNPLALSGVAHCWARGLRFLNADSGPFVSGRFCTLDGLTFDSARTPDRALGAVGHHGISIGGTDNLVTRFRFNARYVHDLTVSGSSMNVFSRGSGVDLCFDHHKRAPFANLFTDIDLGAGTRMVRSGGGDALGKHSGAWTTFWNIRAARPQSWPPANFAPDLVNLVGVFTKEGPIKQAAGKWFEPIAPAALTPSDLHEAQLQRRLAAAPGTAAR